MKKNIKKNSEVVNVSYEITWDALPEAADEKLLGKDSALYEKAHGWLKTKPEKAIPILKSLALKYPKKPRLLNNLHVANTILGNQSEADDLLKKMQTEFPDYLFAKILWASHCLNNGMETLIPKIFDGKYSLKLLYPERNVFHVSEEINFAAIMGLYFSKIGKLDSARIYLDLIEELDYNNAAVFSLRNDIMLGELERRVSRKGALPNKKIPKEHLVAPA